MEVCLKVYQCARSFRRRGKALDHRDPYSHFQAAWTPGRGTQPVLTTPERADAQPLVFASGYTIDAEATEVGINRLVELKSCPRLQRACCRGEVLEAAHRSACLSRLVEEEQARKCSAVVQMRGLERAAVAARHLRSGLGQRDDWGEAQAPACTLTGMPLGEVKARLELQKVSSCSVLSLLSGVLISGKPSENLRAVPAPSSPPVPCYRSSRMKTLHPSLRRHSQAECCDSVAGPC